MVPGCRPFCTRVRTLTLPRPYRTRRENTEISTGSVIRMTNGADKLRLQADVFIDLVELQDKVGRDPAERPARTLRDTSTFQELHGKVQGFS